MKKIIFFILVLPAIAYADKWETFSEKDAITDFERKWVTISNVASTPAGDNVNAEIRIGCGNEGPFVSFEYSTTTVEMIYRVDSNQPVEVTKFFDWDMLHTSLFTGKDAVPKINEILDGKKLVLRRQENLSALSQSEHHYRIYKNSKAIKSALSECWPGNP